MSCREESEGTLSPRCRDFVDHSCDGGICSSIANPLDRRPSSPCRAALGRTVWLPLCFRQLSGQQAVPAAAKRAGPHRRSPEAYVAAGAVTSAPAAAHLASIRERYLSGAPTSIPGTASFHLFSPALSRRRGSSLYVGATALAATVELARTEHRTVRLFLLFHQPSLNNKRMTIH